MDLDLGGAGAGIEALKISSVCQPFLVRTKFSLGPPGAEGFALIAPTSSYLLAWMR